MDSRSPLSVRDEFSRNDNVAPSAALRASLAATAKQKPQVKPGAKYKGVDSRLRGNDNMGINSRAVGAKYKNKKFLLKYVSMLLEF